MMLMEAVDPLATVSANVRNTAGLVRPPCALSVRGAHSRPVVMLYLVYHLLPSARPRIVHHLRYVVEVTYCIPLTSYLYSCTVQSVSEYSASIP